MIRFGIFDHFKDDKTLLIWGETDFTLLENLFRKLSSNETESIDLENLPWMTSVGDCAVTIVATNAKRGSIQLSGNQNGVNVRCIVPSETLLEFADKIKALSKPDCKNGHQYLDVSPTDPIQIIVSKGEYPSDLVQMAQ